MVETGKRICIFYNSVIFLLLHSQIKSFHHPGESNARILSSASIAEVVSLQEGYKPGRISFLTSFRNILPN